MILSCAVGSIFHDKDEMGTPANKFQLILHGKVRENKLK
jgi:hypothetical protein